MKMNNFIIGIIDNADFIFYSWSYLFDFIRCILGNTGDMFGKMIRQNEPEPFSNNRFRKDDDCNRVLYHAK
mgnify:FL=1